MSGFRTHLLVGAAGGVVLARFLALHPTLAGRDGTAAIPLAGHPGSLRGVLALAGLVAGSAVLATWSDIDEPGSWIARRARAALTLLGAVLGTAAGWAVGARRLAPGGPLDVERPPWPAWPWGRRWAPWPGGPCCAPCATPPAATGA